MLAAIWSYLYLYYAHSFEHTWLSLCLNYSMPLVLGLHLLVCLGFLVFRRKSFWVICLPLLFVGDLVKSIIVFNRPLGCNRPELTVLNYNVGTFDIFRFHKKSKEIVDTTYEMPQVKFLISSGADVICLQEFYNNDLVHSEAVIHWLSKAGYTYYYTNPKWIDYSKGFYGLITFSKYPILKSGSIDFDYKEDESRIFNKGIYSDVIVHSDTVRIVNIHLHSMSLNLGEVGRMEGFREKLKNVVGILNKLEEGALKRSEQVEILKREIDRSPYPVLMCGDFNDLPSSYTYRCLKKRLNNTHEAVGSGFGFTYNKAPWFVRIDNQFFDPRITPRYSQVLTKNTLSDHFPLIAGYEIDSN